MGVSREDVLQALAERLSEGSLLHAVRVASACERIASAYSVDSDAAWLAGALHDWDKELGDEGYLDAALEAGVTITDVDRKVPYLLHAKTAAVHVVDRFPGLAQEVVDAIARHTVGGALMTPLDKVVYVADMIEEGRCWEGVDEVRSLVGSVSLDALFATAYRESLLHLVQRGKYIHPSTIEAWNSLVSDGCL